MVTLMLHEPFLLFRLPIILYQTRYLLSIPSSDLSFVLSSLYGHHGHSSA